MAVPVAACVDGRDFRTDDIVAGLEGLAIFEPAVARLPAEMVVVIARIVAAWDAAEERGWGRFANKGHGSHELVAMLGVCHGWREPLLAFEPAWRRLLEARFPALQLSRALQRDHNGKRVEPLAYVRKGRLPCREHFLLQQTVERLRGAAVSPPPRCTIEGAKLEDFTFTIEAKRVGWHEDTWFSTDEEERAHYPRGSIESWAGPLSRFDYDGCEEDGTPLMGSLQLEDAKVEVNVYVTTPDGHTCKIYERGKHDYDEEFCGGEGQAMSFFTRHKLPYAYETPPEGFKIGINCVIGSVGVVIEFEDSLPEEDVLVYLRGEEVPFLDDAR